MVTYVENMQILDADQSSEQQRRNAVKEILVTLQNPEAVNIANQHVLLFRKKMKDDYLKYLRLTKNVVVETILPRLAEHEKAVMDRGFQVLVYGSNGEPRMMTFERFNNQSCYRLKTREIFRFWGEHDICRRPQPQGPDSFEVWLFRARGPESNCLRFAIIKVVNAPAVNAPQAADAPVGDAPIAP